MMPQPQGYGGPPLGLQLAFVLQFIGLMIFLQPLMQIALPASVSSELYSNNGIVNGTLVSYNVNFQSPVIGTANSTSGFSAISSSGLSNFGGLAFIYLALGQLWTSITNFPKLIYIIFVGLLGNISFLPIAIVALASIMALSYVLVSDFFKLLDQITKSDIENIGN